MAAEVMDIRVTRSVNKLRQYRLSEVSSKETAAYQESTFDPKESVDSDDQSSIPQKCAGEIRAKVSSPATFTHGILIWSNEVGTPQEGLILQHEHRLYL